MPGLAGQQIRWMLLYTAPRALAELVPGCRRPPTGCAGRGVEVRTGQSVTKAGDGVRAAVDGKSVHPVADLVRSASAPTRSRTAWTSIPTGGSRWSMSPWLRRPGHLRVRGLRGVPDLTRPGEVRGMTLKTPSCRASRSPGTSPRPSARARPSHTNTPHLGFLVDLGGRPAPRTRCTSRCPGPPPTPSPGYHLSAMSGNRMRVLTDWILNGITSPEATSLGRNQGRVRAARRRQTASLNEDQ